jgi:hypothetical protein
MCGYAVCPPQEFVSGMVRQGTFRENQRPEKNRGKSPQHAVEEIVGVDLHFIPTGSNGCGHERSSKSRQPLCWWNKTTLLYIPVLPSRGTCSTGAARPGSPTPPHTYMSAQVRVRRCGGRATSCCHHSSILPTPDLTLTDMLARKRHSHMHP